MLENFYNGGPVMILMFLLICCLIFISVKNVKEPYYTNSIVFLGIFSASIGVLSTYIGIDAAISLVQEITNISPQILINGIETSLITSFTGIIIMLISTILWFYFIKRHNLYVS